MQALYGESAPFGSLVRYRVPGGESRWHTGEMVQISRAELMFLCETPLELHAGVEVVLPAKVQVLGREASLRLLCAGRVIRRFLDNWPDLRAAVTISISHCEIASDATSTADAA